MPAADGTRLATDVYLGLPFVPFAGDSRLATPIGLVTLALALLVGVLTVRSWWPPLRAGDLPGALLLGTALGCIVLTFAAADPEQEVVGPLGYALLPLVNSPDGGDRLTEQIKALRRSLAIEMGFVMPAVRILDNMTLPPHQYLVFVRGTEAARGSPTITAAHGASHGGAA